MRRHLVMAKCWDVLRRRSWDYFNDPMNASAADGGSLGLACGCPENIDADA